MNRVFALHPFSLIAGLALGVVCLLSMSQVSAPRDSWGPPKKDIVNVYSGSAAGISIPPGGSFTVYTVPNDRWLTLTGASGNSSISPTTLWAEEFSNSSTVKGFADGTSLHLSPGNCGGAIGWTFRPGANVVLLNSHPSSTANVSEYALIGYLSRE